MRYAVIGGAGRVGGHVIAQAHAVGDGVKTLVRSGRRLRDAAPAIGVVEGDVLDPDALDSTLAGTDVVISTIGFRGLGKTTLYSRGTSSILAAMQRTGVRRFIGISAAGVEIDPALRGVVATVLVPLVYGEALADMRTMEEVLARCRVDWTVVRPARLTDGPRTGTYRHNERFLPTGGTQISRADLADFLLQVAADGLYVRARPAIAY
jgi:putative NADH-flavin reductase